MDREDWQEAIQIPLGILPGGSGNALAASVHHYSQWVSPLMSHLNAWTTSTKGEQRRTFLGLKKNDLSRFCVIMPKADWAHHSPGGRTDRADWNCCAVQRRSFQASNNSHRSDVMGLETCTLWVIIVQSAAVEPVVPAQAQGIISICWLAVGTTSKKKANAYSSPQGFFSPTFKLQVLKGL